MELALSSTINVPKMSSSTLEIKNNYYVIKNGLFFNYFPIKVEETPPEANIIRFEKTPPVIVEGVAIISKKLYRVTAQDLLRGVIRKSREIAIAKREEVNGTTKSTTNSRSYTVIGTEESTGSGSGDIAIPETVRNPTQRTASPKTELEIGEAADAAWQDQVGALLDFMHSKEGIEWEVADPS